MERTIILLCGLLSMFAVCAEAKELDFVSRFGYAIKLVSESDDLTISEATNGNVRAVSSSPITVYYNGEDYGTLSGCHSYGKDIEASENGGRTVVVFGENPFPRGNQRAVFAKYLSLILARLDLPQDSQIVDFNISAIAADGGRACVWTRKGI